MPSGPRGRSSTRPWLFGRSLCRGKGDQNQVGEGTSERLPEEKAKEERVAIV